MTDRKPKGNSPVAPQRPKKAGSSSNASKNGTADTASTQQIPRTTDGSTSNKNPPAPSQNSNQAKPATNSQTNTQGKGQQNAQGKAQPAPQAKAAPSSGPKTAGEIAAETAPSPAPAAKPKQQPTQAPPPARAPEPVSDPAAARTARLRLARIDPWSVMKVAFALSIALAIVTVIAISIVWFVLGAAGVWDAVNSSVASLLSDDAESFDITEYVGYGRVIGFALLVSAVDVVLITAIATLGAFLYNLAASLLGGLELTLAEDS